MATLYVVLELGGSPDATEEDLYAVLGEIEATNAEQACRRIAEKMNDNRLGDGVTFIAIPARNWTSGRNTFAAKTERKLIRS